MEENIKQALVEALVGGYGMTVEEAEDRILNSDELDGGIGVELMEETFDLEETEFEAVDLYQEGHRFDMNVSAEQGFFHVLLMFQDRPNVAAVEEAFESYEASSLSEVLLIDNDIESDEDALRLAYNIEGDLREGLMHLFGLLKKAEVKQLLDKVLIVED